MPIIDNENWEKSVANNTDAYGGACISVARRVMELLDETEGDFDCHKLICQANRETDTEGITGFMAGAVASMVSGVHSRGEEFRRKWNQDTQIGDEGDKANKAGGVLNPAVLHIKT